MDTTTGETWTRVKSWFGDRLHLSADTAYEIPVTFEVTRASAAESPVVSRMIRSVLGGDSVLEARCADFSADRGLDGGPLKAQLWDEYPVRPLIDTRQTWREEKAEPGCDPSRPILRPLYPERADTVMHSEKGEVICRCPSTGEEHPMAFQGFEADRTTLKYRCPAAAYNLTCQGRAICYRQVVGCPAADYVRIDLDKVDRRMFTPTPHGSPSWQRGYTRRTALERINARLNNDFGFERHFIRGHTAMKTRVGLALAIMMALALGHLTEGRPGQIRSLVGEVPFLDTG